MQPLIPKGIKKKWKIKWESKLKYMKIYRETFYITASCYGPECFYFNAILTKQCALFKALLPAEIKISEGVIVIQGITQTFNPKILHSMFT